MDELKQEFGKFEVQFFAWKNEVNRHTEKLDTQYAELLSGLKKSVDTIFSLNERMKKLESKDDPAKAITDLAQRIEKLEKLAEQKPVPIKKSFWNPLKK